MKHGFDRLCVANTRSPCLPACEQEAMDTFGNDTFFAEYSKLYQHATMFANDPDMAYFCAEQRPLDVMPGRFDASGQPK